MAVPVAKPVRRTRHARGYRRILVPLGDDRESEQAMAIASRLAADHRATITAVTAIEVPPELPIDADMVEEEARAKRLLGEAQAIGELYGVSVAARVVRARGAGEAIVEEAIATNAEIVILRAFRKRARRLGRTVDVVMKQAPCRVMISAARADS